MVPVAAVALYLLAVNSQLTLSSQSYTTTRKTTPPYGALDKHKSGHDYQGGPTTQSSVYPSGHGDKTESDGKSGYHDSQGPDTGLGYPGTNPGSGPGAGAKSGGSGLVYNKSGPKPGPVYPNPNVNFPRPQNSSASGFPGTQPRRGPGSQNPPTAGDDYKNGGGYPGGSYPSGGPSGNLPGMRADYEYAKARGPATGAAQRPGYVDPNAAYNRASSHGQSGGDTGPSSVYNRVPGAAQGGKGGYNSDQMYNRAPGTKQGQQGGYVDPYDARTAGSGPAAGNAGFGQVHRRGPGYGPDPGFGQAGGQEYGPSGGPGFGQAGSPGYGQTGGPGFGQAGSPGYGQTGGPGFGQAGSPGYGQVGGPGYGQGGNPGFGQAGVPGYHNGQVGAPGFGQGGGPGYKQTGGPGFGQAGGPGFGQAGGPGYRQVGAPGFGQVGDPGYGQAGSPGFGQARGPGYGQAGNPGYGQPGGPGYGKTGTRCVEPDCGIGSPRGDGRMPTGPGGYGLPGKPVDPLRRPAIQPPLIESGRTDPNTVPNYGNTFFPGVPRGTGSSEFDPNIHGPAIQPPRFPQGTTDPDIVTNYGIPGGNTFRGRPGQFPGGVGVFPRPAPFNPWMFDNSRFFDYRSSTPDNIVAFSASSRSSQTFFKPGKVMFDDVVTNIGGAFNYKYGVFTAPVSGIYIVDYHAASHDKTGKPAVLDLFKNEMVVNSARAKGAYGMASNSAILYLNRFDRLSVRGRTGTAIFCETGHSFCSFNAALLRMGMFSSATLPRSFPAPQRKYSP